MWGWGSAYGKPEQKPEAKKPEVKS